MPDRPRTDAHRTKRRNGARKRVPELLAPAGSLDAVRAAVANGADAVYLGVERFNARDEGAQLTVDELETACRLARGAGVRVYLTLNTLVKPGELADALDLLGRAVDCGIDAVIVQDLGLVRLIQQVFPDLEIHGSTQMTVHDEHGARLLHDLGVHRVVIARENTLDDLRAIRSAAPELGIEAFVHGALCISYSGQCLMSGMISERSANRGSCAQACRKDYVLTDDATHEELDRGFLISARDLAAHDALAELSEIGVTCLKIEGRKKKPEYVAIVTKSYREFLDRVAQGASRPVREDELQPLVQIYSRGFTPGMLRGRAARDYVTRAQPDNRGREIGVVTARRGDELLLDLIEPVRAGDGLGFEPPAGQRGDSVGFAIRRVRTMADARAHGSTGSGPSSPGVSRNTRQAVNAEIDVPAGWRVRRTLDVQLVEDARASYETVRDDRGGGGEPMHVRLIGRLGAPLAVLCSVAGVEPVKVTSEEVLREATDHSLNEQRVREQFGRLGGTPFTLGIVDLRSLDPGLFIPVSNLNHLRRQAVQRLSERLGQAREERLAERGRRVEAAVSRPVSSPKHRIEGPATLVAEVFRLDDARVAAEAGANEVVLDPFLRHPTPSLAQVRALHKELTDAGIAFRLRTPTIVRPEDAGALDKWLGLDVPLLSGHVGLACALAARGRDVVMDYGVNCFNQHTADVLFARGARRITASVELTVEEIAALVAPWGGAGFEIVVYGRPEGMTLEHCVLSAAFGRKPTTCRDLCVQKHPTVSVRDPSGYAFPVATDSDCRNRLLHSRPIDASEFLPALRETGVQSFRLVFNVPGDPVGDLVRSYRALLDSLGTTAAAPGRAPRTIVGTSFTRGHFARPV